MNNYEQIKNMTIDEMAELLYNFTLCSKCPATSSCNIDLSCHKTIELWLQEECE